MTTDDERLAAIRARVDDHGDVSPFLHRDGAFLLALVDRLKAERNEALEWAEDDKPLPEDEDIEAAFPTRTDKHELYAEAMRLVGAKRSKRALVALVNWLLFRLDVKQRVAEDRTKERDEARADHLEALADSEASSQTAIDAVAEVASLRARVAKLERVAEAAREYKGKACMCDACKRYREPGEVALIDALVALDECPP